MTAMFAFGYMNPLALLLAGGVTTLSFVTILIQIGSGIKRGGFNVLMVNKRYYGGLIVHIGVVMIAYGIIASSFTMFKPIKFLLPASSSTSTDIHFRWQMLNSQRERTTSLHTLLSEFSRMAKSYSHSHLSVDSMRRIKRLLQRLL